MADIQTVSIALAGIGVFIAAINSILSSRKADQQRQTEIQTRQAELFMQLYEGWREQNFRKAYLKMEYHHKWDDTDDFWQKYGPETNLDEFVDTYVRQATFYEGVGVLVEMGLIDIQLVDRLLRNTTLRFWKRMRTIYLDARLQQPPDAYPHYDSTEYLYNLMKEMGPQHSQP